MLDKSITRIVAGMYKGKEVDDPTFVHLLDEACHLLKSANGPLAHRFLAIVRDFLRAERLDLDRDAFACLPEDVTTPMKSPESSSKPVGRGLRCVRRAGAIR